MVIADTPLLRRWPAAYKDGVYEPSGHDRPNPLDLSQQLLNGTIGTKSKTGKTALLVFFGNTLQTQTHFNPLKPEAHLTYLKENTMNLHYKDQWVNAV